MIKVDFKVTNLIYSLQSIFILVKGVSNIFEHLSNNFFIFTNYNF